MRVNSKDWIDKRMKRQLGARGSLADNNPEVAKQWHPTKNGGLTPQDVLVNSGQKVWWLCEKCGRSWHTSVASRKNETGCICDSMQRQAANSRKTRVNRVGSLAETYPVLMKEWHPTRNGDLTPADISAGVDIKVWWQCDKGHEWEAQVQPRAKHGVGCPYCSGERKTSFPEQTILYYLSKEIYCESRTKIYGKEIDIFIPSLKVGIEYDGRRYHKSHQSAKRELKKDKHFTDCGIKLYRVKESDSNLVDESKRVVYCAFDQRYNFLDRAVKILGNLILGKEIDVNVKNDTSKILAQYIELEKQNSIAIKCPESLEFWNVERNGKLRPEQVPYGGGKKVWWRCQLGHEWQSPPYAFVGGLRCPYCSNQKLLLGYNDLATTNPELAKQWHPTKNGSLKPTQISGGYGKKAWWIGKCGHEWQAVVSSRNYGGFGCPICSGKKTLAGFNDLETKNPKLAKQWHPIRNGEIVPSMVSANSAKKFWWVCDKRHEYQASIVNRNKGRGCPICAGKKVLVGFNDLATKNPSLTREWHPTKNGKMTPNNVTAGSGKKAWWLCNQGHEWQAVISSRAGNGNGCPICARERRKK